MTCHPTGLLDLYHRLRDAYGCQMSWWPGREDPFEIIVGALLVQRTTWTNAATAIERLRAANLLTPAGIANAAQRELEAMIRPSGFFRAKTKALTAFVCALGRDYDGDLSEALDRPVAELRPWLLSIWGIGDETADAILVYAAGVPSFVIDAFTRRLLGRLGTIDGNESYATLQRLFSEALSPDAEMCAEYHALLVQHAKTHCRPRPRCSACPLDDMCAYRAKEAGSDGQRPA